MWSRKYVVPEICRPDDNMSAICRPETGENMSAQKNFLGGAAPEPPRGGLRPPAPPEGGPSGPPSYPPARPAQALRHYYSCKEYNTYPTVAPPFEDNVLSVGSRRRICAKISIISFLCCMRASSINNFKGSLVPSSFFSSSMRGHLGM
jgi:hypothetical protein